MNNKARIVVFSLTIFFSLLTVIGSYYYSGLTGGTDLRNRIVGARLMRMGYSPYFYKWHPADGERLLDPNDIPTRLANGNTVTPAVFLMNYPFTNLNYPSIRLAWTTVQLLMIFGLVWMMKKRYRGNTPLFAAAVVILGLLANNYWFLNVEKGQIHVFYVFFFALMYFIYTANWRHAEFISGLIGGLFLFFRPFAGIIFLGFLLHGKINWLKGWLTGVLAGLFIFVMPNVPVWKDYFRAMEEYGNECLGKGHHIPNTVAASFPSEIEGTRNLGRFQAFNITNLPAIYGVVKRFGIEYTPIFSYLTCGIIFLLLSFLFFKQKENSSPIHLFLFAFLAYMVAELFMLAWRNPYAVISWIFPLFLILQRIQQRVTLLAMFLIALLFLHNYPFYFRFQVAIAELILLFLVAYLSFTGPGIKADRS